MPIALTIRMDRRHAEIREERLERKKAEIAARLECVCRDLDRADFERLVERIAEIDLKYALRQPKPR